MSDARIVLVKPGDVLMIGNVTLPEDEEALKAFDKALSSLKETLGLQHILIFEDDIDLAVKPQGSVNYAVRQDAQLNREDVEQALMRQDAMSRIGRFT